MAGRCAIKEHRLHKRFNSAENCLLAVRDEYYPATVRNISFGGALVHPYKPLTLLRVGDDCSVCMDNEYLSEYPCKVSRLEAAAVALEFTGRHSLEFIG